MKTGVKLMISQACAGLLLDPGLGKTSITLAAFKILKDKGYVNRVLVISTKKGIYNSWGGDNGEIEKWRDFSHLRWSILHGPDKEQALGDDADVFLINPAGLPWLFSSQKVGKKVVINLDRFKQLGVDMLVVDESTDFKAHDSIRMKILKQVLGKFKRRYILTGTISPNGLMDLFGQIYILDQGAALGQYITHYRNNYFYPSGFGGYTWTPQNGALERITERIAPLVLRMEAKDYLDLPELVVDKRFVDLPPEAASVYKAMEDSLIALLESGEITAANEAVASGKCRQICGGALYSTDVLGKRDYKVLHTAKLDAVEELLDELNGEPLLLFYEFNFELEMIMGRFPTARPFTGKDAKDAEIIAAFNRGEIKLLPAQAASSSKSLNLQKACSHVGWYTQTWKADDHLQGIMRVRRQGNTADRVISHYFMVKGTIDEVVFARTVQKDALSQNLSDAIKALRSGKTVA